MSDFLIKKFVKNDDDYENNDVRQSYGMLVSMTGIICNLVLFITKLIVGLALASVAIVADSVNNLSDAASSIVTMAGFKLASKPPDKEHPFGHGRFEDISAFIISFVILLLGYEFLKSSILKIITPEAIHFNYISVMVLCITMIVKIWLSAFNKKIGRRIHSEACMATSQDAANDVYITLATIISLVFTRFTGIIIDGYAGVIVAGLLLYSGFNIARDVVSNLLGKSVSQEFAKRIIDAVENYDGILGTHDLIVHNYGPNTSLASIHAEVSVHAPIEQSHKLMEDCEREVGAALGIILVIHMDPIDNKDKRLPVITQAVNNYITGSSYALEAHEFHIVDNGNKTNVMFELVVKHDCTQEQENTIKRELAAILKKCNKKFICTVHIESGYIDH